MKTVYLLGTRIKQYFVTNKLIFSLFVVGALITAIAFMYFYGNVVSVVVMRGSNEQYFREYRVSTDYEIPLSSALDLEANELIERVTVVCETDNPVPSLHEPYIEISAVLTGEPPVVLRRGSLSFDESDPYQIIVSVNCSLKIGEYYSVLGHAFRVIGAHTGDQYYIPYSTYEALGLKTRCLYVLSAERHAAA